MLMRKQRGACSASQGLHLIWTCLSFFISEGITSSCILPDESNAVWWAGQQHAYREEEHCLQHLLTWNHWATEGLDISLFSSSFLKFLLICLFWDRALLNSIGLPKLSMLTRLASSSQRLVCLCLPSSVIKGVHHHVWFSWYVYLWNISSLVFLSPQFSSLWLN